MKDKMNEIKHREKFRPFAPVVKEDKANEWFELCSDHSYMNYAVKCKQPKLIPSVVHFGKSRVQTVNEYQNAELYELLDKFEKKTGVPILMNTSLNIKGQPLVNSKEDAINFEKLYKVKVY